MSEKKRQWELKHGCGPHRHLDEEGRRIAYEPGEVIHDSRDLDAMFPHKFNELGVTKAKKEKKKKSKLVKDRSFERVPSRTDEEHVTSKEVQDEVDDETDDDDDTTTEEEGDEENDETLVKSKFGKDVTGEFDLAAKSDLKVFAKKGKKGTSYTVVDADELDKPLNAKKDKLKSSAKVEKFLRDYRKG